MARAMRVESLSAVLGSPRHEVVEVVLDDGRTYYCIVRTAVDLGSLGRAMEILHTVPVYGECRSCED